MVKTTLLAILFLSQLSWAGFPISFEDGAHCTDGTEDTYKEAHRIESLFHLNVSVLESGTENARIQKYFGTQEAYANFQRNIKETYLLLYQKNIKNDPVKQCLIKDGFNKAVCLAVEGNEKCEK